MEKFVIHGGKPLVGEVEISGAKNAAVAILPATILAGGKCVIENLPNISDVSASVDILSAMGAHVRVINKHTLEIDTAHITATSVPNELSRQMRASYYFLGALLGRFGKATVAMPGGCNLGPRPIDQHLKAFVALGAKDSVEYGMISVESDSLRGEDVFFDTVSVGATINAMLAAVMAEGQTVLENVAKEPHIVDVANFLNMMGADVRGAGTDVIKIRGVKQMHGCTYSIIPDQIEAGSYMVAAAATGGDVLVKNIIPKHMDSLTAKLEEMNVKVAEWEDSIRVMADEPLRAVNVKTMSYPGFPTDLQPQIATLLAVCNGTSVLTENVWENRYQYMGELRKLGADVEINGRVATIHGIKHFSGAEVSATDLRAGAAMILAALAAEGETIIDGVRYIDRGYEDVEEKFRAMGADIDRIPGEQ